MTKRWGIDELVERSLQGPADVTYVADNFPRLDMQDLGEILRNPIVRGPQVRVAAKGKRVPKENYVKKENIGRETVNDSVDAEKVAFYLARGATITFDSLEFADKDVAEVCRRIADRTGLAASATAYVTAPGRAGLLPHTDEEDVVLVQTAGRKAWRYRSPEKRSTETSGLFPESELSHIDPIVLEPGMALVLPAGSPHAAQTLESYSIHVTYSVERPRHGEIVRARLNQLIMNGHPALIQHLAYGLKLTAADYDLAMAALIDAYADIPDVGINEMAAASSDVFGDWERLRSSECVVSPRANISVENQGSSARVEFDNGAPAITIDATHEPLIRYLAAGSITTSDFALVEGVNELMFTLAGLGTIDVKAV